MCFKIQFLYFEKIKVFISTFDPNIGCLVQRLIREMVMMSLTRAARFRLRLFARHRLVDSVY